MQVSKWGNSLAIRIPSSVVKALELSEGDNVEVTIPADRIFVIHKAGKKDLLGKLRKFRGKLPADFKFDRDEANV
jgi:antitoxin MazE